MKILAINRKAKFDYDILEKFEAGIELLGPEVKSAKLGQMSLKGSYVIIRNKETWLLGAHISPYKFASKTAFDPKRTRKLLLHKKEINYLIGKSKEKGLTLVPLSVYTKKGIVKLQFGLGRGKRKYEKRAKIKESEAKRKIERLLRKKP